MSEQRELMPCPCGKTPETLIFEEGHTCKWAWVCGSCCSEWSVEFGTDYFELEDQRCRDLGVKAWNRAQRKLE